MQKNDLLPREQRKVTVEVPFTLLRFIDFCRKLGHGELQKVQIQDGVPIYAEKSTKKIKFN